MWAWVTAVAAAGARAGDDVRVESPVSTVIIVAPQKEAFDIVEGFKISFTRHVDEIFLAQFHPLNALNWNLKLGDGNPGPLRDRPNSAARQAFTKSVLYGIRETTVDLPVMVWLEERQDFFMGLLENSIGGVEEESVAPLSLSYQDTERSWWNSLAESGLRYGIRPFRTDPYAYLGWRIKDRDKVLLLTNVRYHYVDFGDHSFEFALSVPFARGLSINFGTSYRFGRHDEEKRVAVKISKVFKRGSIWHVGLDVREHESPGLFAGITIPM
jgi:hypothetical protein